MIRKEEQEYQQECWQGCGEKKERRQNIMRENGRANIQSVNYKGF